MRRIDTFSSFSAKLIALAVAVPLMSLGGLPAPAVAASVTLATAPLTTSTTTSVKPNLLFVLDNSGSMAWDHMPDDSSDGGSSVSFQFGFYGLRSTQCNQIYYDPATTYTPPVDASATQYTDAVFTAARTDGFNTGSGTVNLNSAFRASQSLGGDGSDQTAYFYAYSGSQLTAQQKNYHSTTSTFYSECNSANNVSPGQDVFTRVVLGNAAVTTTAKLTLTCSSCTSTVVTSIKVDGVEIMTGASAGSSNTSTAATNVANMIGANGFGATASSNVVTITGVPDSATKIVVTKSSGNMSFSPTVYQKADSAKLTNFANWYSFYRTRMLMMKTSAGRAFSALDGSYRVGLLRISESTPVVGVGAFESTHRSDWYTALYGTNQSGSTPLRTALSTAGRYYAGKLSGVTDPIQYSCQQNFSILSTDGYWNSGDGRKLDGSTIMGNEDGSAARPMFDGAVALGTSTVSIQYTRNNYTCGGCGSSQNMIRTQPEKGSCSVTVTGTPTGGESCTPTSWSNNGSRIDSGVCVANATCTSSLPSPNPSTKVEASRSVNSDVSGGSSNSLADVAMYYYENDLRTSALGNCTGTVSGENVCENNVFKSALDNNTKQHMTTFTLGMGVSGRMLYSQSYLTDLTGDYVSVKDGLTNTGGTVCSWQAAGTQCNWPVPGLDGSSNGYLENIDDLWHAAVNGRGAYFAATSPTSLAAGLANALAGLNSRKGSAAAAATSTLNPVAGNNFAYVASYTTVSWKGNLEARGINTETGVVNVNASWCVEDVSSGSCASPSVVEGVVDGDTTTYYCKTPNSTICVGGTLNGTDCYIRVASACSGTMKSMVSATSDSRNIYTSNGSASPSLVAFDSAYATANPTYFAKAHISGLSQWSSLTSTQQDAAAGATLVNFLRGRYGNEDRTSNTDDNRQFRVREATMGDALESQPAFLGAPVFSYPYPGYSAYKTAQSGRAGSVFMGTNDGMMHSFNASTGVERWAYVPTMVISNLWKLADKNYAALHTNYVNGSPVTSDVCVSGCDNAATAVWKTIMVGGLNAGGRGYYAIDITVPDSPVLLWEFTTTSGSGKVKDDDLGYSFGLPVITRKADGTWVVLVTSGYNNTSPGTGKGFLYVLNAYTGQMISKIGTGAGSTTTPSGLAKVAAWNTEATGNTAGYVYGGDLQGQVWRFNINDSTTPAAIGTGSSMLFAELFSDIAGTQRQPITSTPTLATIAGKRVIIISTGKFLETSDLTTTQIQSIYAIKDDDATTSLTNPRNSLVRQTLQLNVSDNTKREATSNPVNFYSGRGWFVDLAVDSNSDGTLDAAGERVHVDARLVQGVLLVASTVPVSTACSPGGYGWLNYFDYETGTAINTLVSTRYDSPIVGINVLYIQGQPIVEVVTSDNPTPEKNPDPEFKANAPAFTGKRVIWRELAP